MTASRKSRLSIPIVVLGVIIGLSACAPPTTVAAGGGAATAPSPASSGSGSQASGSRASGAKDIQACTLASTSSVNAAMGTSYTGATSHMIAPGQDECTYASGDDSDELDVIIYQPNSGVTWTMMTGVLKSVGSVSPVSGIGDKAQLGEIELDIQSGAHLVAIEGGAVSANNAGAEALGKALVGALG